jgi:hypothetical protein
MPEAQDYWPPDIGETNIITPVSLMREQAALLGQKTNQQITANVQGVGSQPTQFNWSFQLVSPSLGSYRYELFRVSHPLTLYPSTFQWEGHPDRNAGNEQEFRDILKDIIASDQTKTIVHALLAQIVR